MKSGFLLNVVIRKGTTVFKLLACEDEALLVGWDALFVLNFRLDVIDGIAGLHIQGDGLSSQSLDEYLHASAQAQHQMKSRLLLDVVVRKRATVFELLACEDQSLLIWRDAFFVLNFRLDVIDGIAGLHIQGDGLSSQSLDEDLHASAQAQHQMK